MKPAILAIAVLSCASLLAAQTTPADAPAPSRETPRITNKVEAHNGPSYSEQICAGGILQASISPKLHVVGSQDSLQARLGMGDTIFLAGGGYEVGAKYLMVRKGGNLNRDEYYPGQHSAVKKYGEIWEVLGVTQVIEVVNGTGVGRITFSCTDALPGDRLIPYEEPQTLFYTRKPEQFVVYNPTALGATGVILESREYVFMLGVGQVIYVNLGADKGLKPGDYLRISRGYKDKSERPTVDAVNDRTPADDPTDLSQVKVTKKDLDARPRRGVGEAMILSVNGKTATAIITLSPEDIHPGDRVEQILP